ncbi:lipopolysaccharide biosynthesis protein-like protein [Burkholderia pseudomultivorans]|uniref:Lipopolysaccharide biosynthesis protein-like protein n=2 Tax=Burkholderia pseudomultivorans TaxID=1207504 RepID=A0A6P2RUQ5_9BURK|nr:lipopolysaccharide biosynthesis protein-like protein [Burkholderia pseudomultivorans]
MTRAMETMGAEFGDNLMPAVAGVNDKGFFEDLDIYAINVEILMAAGAEWHSVGPVELDRIDSDVLQRIRGKAVEVLTKKCEGRTFALKDPRIARLLPFWKSVFRSSNTMSFAAVASR